MIHPAAWRESIVPKKPTKHASQERTVIALQRECLAARDQAPAVQKPRVQSAARTIGILFAIAQSRAGLKVKEISVALKLPRQVTYHLLHTLSATGIIRRREQNRYVLGLAASAIAEGFRRQLGPPEQAASRVRTIADDCGETAYASGWVDGEIAVLATARGQAAVHATEVPHGYSEDAHARASGKLLLALADPDICEAYLSRHRLALRTPKTITSKRRLLAELEHIRSCGYAIDEEEFSQGLCCLAVPIEVAGGQLVLGISVPTDRFHENFQRYLGILGAAAKIDGAAT